MAGWPTIRRMHGEPRLRMWMPYSRDNRDWIHDTLGARIQPVWNRDERWWEISRRHLMPLAYALAERFGQVDVVLEFNELERCDTRCRNANGDDCECSCLGFHHGGGLWHGWIQVGETTLIRPGWRQQHMRLTAEGLALLR
ncbi:hypothetical protein [Micromonospora chersina]|uniref:hypothetical protein n=1 Tax=Micromonospora chersina TaxID=47854 RepID=UPI003723F971